MTVTVATLEKLIETIPKTVENRGESVPFSVESAASIQAGIPQDNQGDPLADLEYPAIVIQDITDAESEDSPITGELQRNPDETTSQSDTFTFSAGTSDYTVTEQDIKPGSTTVTGTLNGASGHTFTEGTDYEVVDKHGEWGGLDTIRWLGGGDEPDDSTDFTVAYEHFTPSQTIGERGDVTMQVHVHTYNLEAGDTKDGVTFSKEHHREDLMRQMLTRLKTWYKAVLPSALVATDAATGSRGPIQDFSYLESRGVLRKGFDMVIRQAVGEKVTARTIRDPETKFKLDVDGDGTFEVEAIDL